METLLGDVSVSSGRILWVEGGPGSGKTRALRRIDALARCRGFGSAYVRAHPGGSAEEGGLIAQVGAPVPMDRGGRPDPDPDRIRALLSPARPTLVVVDDIQWGDRSSLRSLESLLSLVHRMPLGLVLGFGLGERSREPASLASLAGDPDTRRVLLEPLGAEEIGGVVRRQLAAPEPGFVTALAAATGGVPLLVMELLHAARLVGLEPTAAGAAKLVEVGSSALAETVVRRVTRNATSDVPVRLVRALAVLGECEPGLAADVLGVDRVVVDDAVPLLQGLQIVRGDETLRLAQPAIGASLYARMEVDERHELHRRAAARIGRQEGSEERAADHLLRTPPRYDRPTVDLLHRAAQAARSDGLPDRALSYLDRAFVECSGDGAGTGVGPPLDLAMALLRDRPAEALQRLEWLHDETWLPAAERELVAARLAEARAFGGDVDGAVAVLEAAGSRAIAGTDDDPSRAGGGPVAAWSAVLEVVRDGPGSRCPDHHPRASVAVALRAGLSGRAGQGVELAEHLLCAGGGHVDPDLVAFAVLPLVWADRLDEAWAHLDALAPSEGRDGLGPAQVFSRELAALVALQRGDVAAAVRLGRAPSGGRPGRLFALGSGDVLVEALVEAGDLDGAEELLSEVREVGERGHVLPLASFLLRRAQVRLARGLRREALDDLWGCGSVLEGTGTVNPVQFGWRPGAAVTGAALGRAAEARAEVEVALDEAWRWGTPRAIGVALRSAGVVELLAGGNRGPARAVTRLEESVDRLQGSVARLELARSRLSLGWVHRRRNQAAAARAELRLALAGAIDGGADRLAAAAREELVASGARRGQSGLDSRALTGSEGRVAEAAAAGLSNREIAERLYVSRRTVELHLTKVYRKLGIEGRAELRDALECDALARGAPEASFPGPEGPGDVVRDRGMADQDRRKEGPDARRDDRRWRASGDQRCAAAGPGPPGRAPHRLG